MSVTNFTVEFDAFASADDGIDVGVDGDIVAMTGSVIFTPLLQDDKLVLAPHYDPRPTGFRLLPFSGWIDTDGRLKSGPSGTVGVRLWANDPVLELETLTYRVDFNVVGPLGQPVSVTGGYLQAPSTDTTVNLADVLESTGSVSVAEALNATRVNTVLSAAAPAIIDADLAGRNLGFTDAGGGTVQFTLGGEALGDAVTIPGAVWSNLTGTPSDVVNAGLRERDSLRRARPGIPRRVFAPGNLGWLDDVINVFYDGHKFFTDFDVTSYRHTGTKRYSDRVNGSASNSGLATTLTTGLTAGTAVTSLSVAALPADFPDASKVVLFAQDQHGVWRSMVATLSAAASTSATSISVSSVTPDFNFPAGTVVASPNATVNHNYARASAGEQLIMLDRASNTYGGVIDRQGGWGFGEQPETGHWINKSITIAAQFPGEVKLVIGNWHGTGAPSERQWSLKPTYSNVYICTQVNVGRVVDIDMGGQIGPYTKVADAVACEALPGSFYVSGTEVGVHTTDSAAPDPTKVFPLMNFAQQTTAKSDTADMAVYLADFDIIGGYYGCFKALDDTYNLDVYAHRMGFYANTGDDAVNIDGARYVFLQDCRAAFSVKDGFNYGLTNPRFIEANCESWAHGLGNTVSGFENVSNCSTAHTGCQGLRIGGRYHQAVGAVIADVQADCETWTVECDVFDSLSESVSYEAGIDAQQAGVVMHVYNCRVFGSLYDIVVRGSTTMNIYSSEYDTSAVFGTLTGLSSV